MNKRQKKKLFKQTFIKVKKLHPQKGDIIFLQPNLEWIDLNTAVSILNFSKNKKVFGESTVVISPMNIKKLDNKEGEYSIGFETCKKDLMEVIEDLAYQVAQYQNPRVYEYSEETLKDIMLSAGLDKSYLK